MGGSLARARRASSVPIGLNQANRLYRFRHGRIDRRTQDHSLAQLLADRSGLSDEELRGFPRRNVILHALGQNQPAVSISSPEVIQAGDTFLLCTDGLWEHVLEQKMELDLASASSLEDWLARMEAHLLERVQREDGNRKNHDNYTALAIRAVAGP